MSVDSSSLADRFGRLMRPKLSSPMTPAETPSSTVSVKRRRSLSIWSLLPKLLAPEMSMWTVPSASRRNWALASGVAGSVNTSLVSALAVWVAALVSQLVRLCSKSA